jgi:hypothetical protein
MTIASLQPHPPAHVGLSSLRNELLGNPATTCGNVSKVTAEVELVGQCIMVECGTGLTGAADPAAAMK